MSNAELKSKLIEKIQATNDEHLLREATRLLEIQFNEKEDTFELTDEMSSAIEEAQEEIANGEFLTHEDANKQIKKWLEK